MTTYTNEFRIKGKNRYKIEKTQLEYWMVLKRFFLYNLSAISWRIRIKTKTKKADDTVCVITIATD